MAWNTHCDRARSDLSPHAPGASGVNVAAVAPATSTSSPVVATFSPSNVAAPTSSSAKGKERAVDAVSAISDVGAAALGDITNAGADTRRRSKRGKGKDNLGGGVRKAPKNNTTGRAKSTAGVKSIFAAAINDMVDEYDGIHLRGNGVKVDMGGGDGGRSDSILDAGTDSTFAAARKDSTDAGPRLHGRPKDNKTLREYLLRSTLKKKMKAPSYFPGII
ncbi:hypothetical protein K438DRAFT_863634 [Mycena galopus ATCC 62051]|nr:hypothetical protein K438DRAFT_863634 [Mycena galopus ATCC 62051]